MTPREHLAHVLSYTEDFQRALKEVATLVEDEDTYWRRVENFLADEAHWILGACEDMRDAEPDELQTDDPELMARVDTFITDAREGSNE